MKIKLIRIVVLISFFVAVTSHAAPLQFLTNPGPERDQLRKQHESTLKSQPKNVKALRELGIIYHMKAVETKGDPDLDWVRKSYKYLKKAYRKEKKNPLTLIYYGSATTLMALTTERGMEKSKYVKKGTRSMDKAIRIDPNNLNLRMIRGNNSLSLPRFLKRAHYAVEDFSKALEISKAFQKQDPVFSAHLHYKLGLAYELTKQMDKAKEEWNKAIKIAPNSEFAKQAKEKL